MKEPEPHSTGLTTTGEKQMLRDHQYDLLVLFTGLFNLCADGTESCKKLLRVDIN